MQRALAGGARLFGSLRLSCVLLVLLGLLTWLGTLAQVEDGLFRVQKRYFESFFLIHRAGPLAIPLPGANLVLHLLFANLIVGGILRLQKRRRTVGILVGHVGILVLLLSGFVKAYHSADGRVTLFEGEQAASFQSWFRWEIAIQEDLGDGSVREHLVPEEDFRDATGAEPVRLVSDALPFDLEVRHFAPACRVLPKGPAFDVDVPVIDGVFVRTVAQSTEAEQDVAGAYATVVERATGERREGILWGIDRAPWTVEVDGRTFALDLRHERYPMPFTLVLDDFQKEDHPGIGMAKSFMSDVTVVEDSSARPVRISMNEPLRSDGLVLYQASWGPSNARPGDPLFSTFAVVRNPADRLPLYGCIVVAVGLLFHFGSKLARHVRSEVRTS